jgi:glutathione S-transferase
MPVSYITVEQAVPLPGLRIAFTPGVPGPWGEAARAFFDIKKIAYAAVAQEAGGSNPALQQWTGQSSAPVAMLDAERPRSHWSELLLLAERLAPEPPLVPDDAGQRALMFGLAHEICGEDGFGWNARLLMFPALERVASFPLDLMRAKYGDSRPLDRARQRCSAVLDLLAARLAAQTAAGSSYLVGDRLSAADIYWTTFSNLLQPMAAELCAVPAFYRDCAADCAARLGRPVPEILIAHRDRILRQHFILPMQF